jgi:hypothetical protein
MTSIDESTVIPSVANHDSKQASIVTTHRISDVKQDSMSYAEVDIDALLLQMTLEEKLSLLAGSHFWGTSGIKRLNVPPLKVNR